MSENSAISPQFNLGEVIRDLAPSEHDQIPVILAANAIKRNLEEDHKTGLATEKAWTSNLIHTAETIAEEDDLIIWVADANGFKKVNDTLGHQAGDELLGIIGTVFETAFSRKSDVLGHGSRENRSSKQAVARLGGDEFAAFSVKKKDDSNRIGSAADEAQAQATRVNNILLASLAGTKFDGFGVGLSIGTAIRQSGEDAQTVFARADMAMFQVKYAGRIDNLTSEDLNELRRIVPFLEEKGARVDNWVYIALGSETKQDI